MSHFCNGVIDGLGAILWESRRWVGEDEEKAEVGNFLVGTYFSVSQYSGLHDIHSGREFFCLKSSLDTDLSKTPTSNVPNIEPREEVNMTTQYTSPDTCKCT